MAAKFNRYRYISKLSGHNLVRKLYCVVPENIHTPPTEGIGNSGEEEGVSKTQKFKAMYGAKLEFPEGWGGGGGVGGHRANPFRGGGGGGMDIFWNHTFNVKNTSKSSILLYGSWLTVFFFQGRKSKKENNSSDVSVTN